MAQSGLPLRSAPILHLALVISSLIVAGIFWFLRGGVPIALFPGSSRILSYLAYAGTAVILVATTIIKNQIPDLERGGDLTAWWSVNAGKVIVLWALGEAACCAGSVLWFLTDNQLVLLCLGGAGLLVLAAYRPSKLMRLV
jgi:hypothetical protein